MSGRKKLIFIVNPIAGTQNKEIILNLLDTSLDKSKHTWEVIHTHKVEEAEKIALEAANNKIDAVIAIGGDGTVNGIARSLVHSQTALGIIPRGSGNGLARDLHIPMDPQKALKVINQGYIDMIDCGTMNGTYFFCTCGVGFDAFVSYKYDCAERRGLLTYLEKALKESLTYHPQTYELEIDNKVTSYKAFLIACGNASQYGNNAYITPQAMLRDGNLDVTLLEPFTILDVPSLAYQLFNKTIDQNSHIKTFRCKQLCIHRNKPGIAHFDGDPLKAEADVRIEVIPKGLKVIIPSPQEETPSDTTKTADKINGIKWINETIATNIKKRHGIVVNKILKIFK